MGTTTGTGHGKRRRRHRSPSTGWLSGPREFYRIIKWQIQNVPGPISVLGIAVIMVGLFGLVLFLALAATSPGPPPPDPFPIKSPLETK